MKKKKINTFKLGVFVISGLFLFILGIYYLGKTKNLFQSTLTVYAQFKDIKGLQLGNNIRFLGIDVGTVNDISILNDSTVSVEMEIDKDITKFLHKDALVEIKNEGVMGSKIVTIHSGKVGAKTIEENDVLQSFDAVSVDDVLDEVENITTLAGTFLKNFSDIAAKLNKGSGTLGKLINNDDIYESINEMSCHLAKTTKQAEVIIHKVNEGDNDIAALLNNNSLTSQLSSTLANFDSTSKNLKSASDQIVRIAYNINNGEGLVHKLIYDSLFTNKVDSTINNVNSGIGAVIGSAESIEESWIVNLFSGKNESKR